MATLIYGSQNFATTLNVPAGIDNAQTSGIVLQSVTGLNANGGMLCFDWAATLDTTVAEFIEYGGLSGNTLTGVVRGSEGLSAHAHANGCTITAIVSQAHLNRIVDKLRGVDTTALTDTNGNAILKTSTTASAVNQVTVANSATTLGPTISATGTDSNIDLLLVSKGTGAVKINGTAVAGFNGQGQQGFLQNGKIVTSVASNNLTVAIKTLAGADPSASDTVYVRIGNTVRTLTAALSVTVNAGVNSFNAGAAETATLEVDYFAYLAWVSGGSALALGFSRRSDFVTYADASGTATAWNYMATSTTPAGTDQVEVIGRFNATLSTGAGYTWTIPGTSVIVNRPVFETRMLSWQPTYSASGSMTWTGVTTNAAKYQIRPFRAFINLDTVGTTGGTAAAEMRATIPFPLNQQGGTAGPVLPAMVGTGNAYIGYVDPVSTTLLRALKYDTSAHALAANMGIQTTGELPI